MKLSPDEKFFIRIMLAAIAIIVVVVLLHVFIIQPLIMPTNPCPVIGQAIDQAIGGK